MSDITTLRPGEHFMFKNFEWVCLDQNHPDGGVLAIMAEPLAKDVKFCPDERYADEIWVNAVPTVDPESLRPSDRIRHLADILENEYRDRFVTIDTFVYTLRRLSDIVAKDEPAH